MTEYLLDANLSPETASFLATEFGFGVVDLGSLRLASSTDDDVVVLAKRLHRVVITFDLDFGHIDHRDPGTFGVIILRLEDQTVESVNRALARFFRQDAVGIALETSLVELDADRARVVRTS